MLLANFLREHFDFDELKRVGFYSDNIQQDDHQKQAERICQYFGYETVYQHGFETTRAHLSYAPGHRPEGEPFVLELRPWHESKNEL